MYSSNNNLALYSDPPPLRLEDLKVSLENKTSAQEPHNCIALLDLLSTHFEV